MAQDVGQCQGVVDIAAYIGIDPDPHDEILSAEPNGYQSRPIVDSEALARTTLGKTDFRWATLWLGGEVAMGSRPNDGRQLSGDGFVHGDPLTVGDEVGQGRFPHAAIGEIDDAVDPAGVICFIRVGLMDGE